MSDVTDELPEDLHASFVGPYRFPDNSRRRITGVIYLVIAAAIAVVVAVAGTDAVLVNGGLAVVAGGLAVIGAYSLVAGRKFGIDETEALVVANGFVDFAVGHASAQLGWRGWLSRPTWRVLVFSAENPPAHRALVMIDASSGAVLDGFIEEQTEQARAEWQEPPAGPAADSPATESPATDTDASAPSV